MEEASPAVFGGLAKHLSALAALQHLTIRESRLLAAHPPDVCAAAQALPRLYSLYLVRFERESSHITAAAPLFVCSRITVCAIVLGMVSA